MPLLPKAHPLARRRAVALSDLAAERLVLREPGSTIRRLVERALTAAELTPPSDGRFAQAVGSAGRPPKARCPPSRWRKGWS